MSINLIYSYNGYDPSSNDVKDRKAELKGMLNDGRLSPKEYSFEITNMKSGFKRLSFVSVHASYFNDTEIVGSCFAQDDPYTDVFPPDMKGVTFRDCNLNNCDIPDNNTIIGGTNKHHWMENDGEQWALDASLRPIEPLSPKRYDDLGLSKKPADLPKDRLYVSIITTAQEDKDYIATKNMIRDAVDDADPTRLNDIIRRLGG